MVLAPGPVSGTAPRPATGAPRWLLFVHQLSAHPSNLRVRTWRRLQQAGALAVKQAVYALPNSAGAREDFEWLKTEIEAAGGRASVFVADTVDMWSHDALVDEFRRARETAYAELAQEAEQQLRRRRAGTRSLRDLQQLRGRLAAIERVDFFGSAGRDRVVALVRQVEERATARPSSPGRKGQNEPPASYNGRLWVTRPRPGVDRMASAFLVRRFIDAEARFDFVADRDAAPEGSVPFDMFGVEFSHRGELCTFEVLCAVFALDEPALARIAAIVHDLDLKDSRFGAAEAPAIGMVIDGLRLSRGDDQALLAEGVTLFEALYRTFSQQARTSGPRPVARRHRTRVTRGRGRPK